MKASVPLSLLLLLFVALCPISGYTQAINNRELLLDMMSGVANYLATTQDEWVEHLTTLIEDAKLRNTIAAAARRDVEQRFAIDVIGPQLEAAMRETVDEFQSVSKTRRAAA